MILNQQKTKTYIWNFDDDTACGAFRFFCVWYLSASTTCTQTLMLLFFNGHRANNEKKKSTKTVTTTNYTHWTTTIINSNPKKEKNLYLYFIFFVYISVQYTFFSVVVVPCQFLEYYLDGMRQLKFSKLKRLCVGLLLCYLFFYFFCNVVAALFLSLALSLFFSHICVSNYSASKFFVVFLPILC